MATVPAGQRDALQGRASAVTHCEPESGGHGVLPTGAGDRASGMSTTVSPKLVATSDIAAAAGAKPESRKLRLLATAGAAVIKVKLIRTARWALMGRESF